MNKPCVSTEPASKAVCMLILLVRLIVHELDSKILEPCVGFAVCHNLILFSTCFLQLA